MVKACPNDLWASYILLCRWAGLRQQEAYRALWSEIDGEAHTITARPMKQKGEKKSGNRKKTTKQGKREVSLVPKLYNKLLEVFNESDRSSKNVNIAPNNHYKEINRIIKNAGVKKYSKPFHTLRKNCETELLEKYPVMDVCMWLGHAPKVAMKHYKQPSKKLMKDITGQTDKPTVKSVAKLIESLSSEDRAEIINIIEKLETR